MSSSSQDFEKVIAIDGPSGSGKSTIARTLASNLKVLYIDTGAMFRALAYAATTAKIEFTEGTELTNFLAHLKMEYQVNDTLSIKINGLELSEQIREHHVSHQASLISQLPSVRNFLLNFQRRLAQNQICVMEGRDIGTVVFLHSFCKFFITASAEVRAQRRLEQLRENGDNSITLQTVIDDVKKRDELDMNRTVAPLKKAEDAIGVDTTNLSLIDVVNILANEVKFRAAHLNIQI
jgi:cytidylate kinase